MPIPAKRKGAKAWRKPSFLYINGGVNKKLRISLRLYLDFISYNMVMNCPTGINETDYPLSLEIDIIWCNCDMRNPSAYYFMGKK